ncbi:MAG: bacteriohopanetetrol glucosamine biosynthesis glycosyltransferase HpnI [Blastocatellia bacterium]
MDGLLLSIGVFCAILTAGSIIYCGLSICAAFKYLAVRLKPNPALPPISLMKPLSGLDDGLRENLRSFFNQDYPDFEVIMAIRHPDDPAAGVARQVMDEFPDIPSELVIVGESPVPNAKVFSLRRIFERARNELVVMADSDTRVDRSFFRVIAAELADERVGLVTCPYRAVPGDSFWSELEAIGLNTEFLSGVLVARMLIGMDFALGPAIATRKSLVEEVGGLEPLQNYLAEDFVLGNLVASAGRGVILSSYRIEHRIGAQDFSSNFEHRLRWARSTRRSRPLGYIGQVFTNPIPLALFTLAASPSWLPLVLTAIAFRFLAAWAVDRRVLNNGLSLRRWVLLPVQDAISFLVWVGGFFGSTVTWRGRRYNVRADGTFGTVES